MSNFIISVSKFISIACIPFQLIEHLAGGDGSSSQYNKMLRLARLPRLYRLVRIFRILKMGMIYYLFLSETLNIGKIFSRSKTLGKIIKVIKMNEGIMKLIKVAIATLLLIHFMTCFWFMFAKLEDFNPDTWVFRVDIRDKDPWYQYLVSTHWCLQTLTTVGFGDIGSKTTMEMLTCCAWMVFGVGFYSFVIGNLSSIMHDIDEKSSKLQNKINALNDFATKTKLPNNTVEKIKRYFIKNQEDDNEIIDPSLLYDLPVAVRAQIMLHTHKDVIETVSFFKEIKRTLLWLILPLMKPMRFYEKDLIYRQQEQAEEVFFIYEGEVTLFLDINDNRNSEPVLVPFNKYLKGSYFGDNDIFCKQLRD